MTPLIARHAAWSSALAAVSVLLMMPTAHASPPCTAQTLYRAYIKRSLKGEAMERLAEKPWWSACSAEARSAAYARIVADVPVYVPFVDKEWGISFPVPVTKGVNPPFIDTGGMHIFRILAFGPRGNTAEHRRYALTDYGSPASLDALKETVRYNSTFHELKKDVPGNPPTDVVIDGRTYLRWIYIGACVEPTVTVIDSGKSFSFSMCSSGNLMTEIQELQELARTVRFLR